MRPIPLRWLPLGLALLAAACSADDEGSPIDPVPGDTVTLPTAPVTFPVFGVGEVAERYTSELAVRGDWAYTGTWGSRGGRNGNALKVWNVSGNTPVLRDSVLVPGAGTLGDVAISDDGRLLMVAVEYNPNGAIVLFDLANPARPTQITRFSSDAARYGVHTAKFGTVNGRLHAFLSVDPVGGLDPVPARLAILDLADPAAPRQVSVLTIGNPFVHDVFVRDGILFTALWNDGLVIWDLGGAGQGGTPASPVRLGTAQTVGGAVHNIFWYHDAAGAKRYAFVGEEQAGSLGFSSAGDIHVVDVSDLRNPREVAFYTVPGAGTHNFSVDERNGVLYAAYYNAGVRALNIRGDLGSCAADQKDARGRCDLSKMGREVGRGLTSQGSVSIWGVQLVGTHLFASDMLRGLWKLDAAGLAR